MPETLTAAEINGRPSHDDLRQLIRRALTNGVDIYGPGAPYVIECSDADCVVERDGKHWRYPYTVNEARDQVTLGTPVLARLNWQDAPTAPIQASTSEAGTRAFVTDLRGLTFSEEPGPVRVEVCRDGTWQHSEWGEITITPETRASFIANYQANVRGCGNLPLDYDHEPSPAPGWITGLVNEGTSLFATVDLTPSGRKKIEDREYCFFSPEWHPNWKHPATGTQHGPTLFGGGLTNRPFFRGMAAINCSEPSSPKGGEMTGARPQEKPMSNPAPGEGAITAAEARQLRDEIATLRAAEDKRELGLTFSEMRFNEAGSRTLAPSSRSALVEALLPLPQAQREAVVNAVKGLQFADLGELGFAAAEPRSKDEPTAEDVQKLAAMTSAGQAALAK